MRLFRNRIEHGRPGDLVLARGQRTIDVAAVLLLLLALAVVALGAVGVAWAFVWAWTLGVPWWVRVPVVLSEAAVVLIGLLGWRVVRGL